MNSTRGLLTTRGGSPLVLEYKDGVELYRPATALEILGLPTIGAYVLKDDHLTVTQTEPTAWTPAARLNGYRGPGPSKTPDVL